MSMNEHIWDNPQQFPAVTMVNRLHIEYRSAIAADHLDIYGCAFAVLEPDDGTRYELTIVGVITQSAQFRFASSFGPLAPWTGGSTVHPDYAQEKYVANGNYWTATVLALFLNEVGESLEAGHPS